MDTTFDTLQAEYDAALPAYYDNPGHDATPGYCALCDEPATADAPLVDTAWGPMHGDCADSHDEAMGKSTFRTMTTEHLGDTATPQDLALFQSVCLILLEQQPTATDAQATDYLWNNGDWYGLACEIVGAPEGTC